MIFHFLHITYNWQVFFLLFLESYIQILEIFVPTNQTHLLFKNGTFVTSIGQLK